MKGSKIYKMLCVTSMLALVTVFVLSGCATKKYVGQQIQPVADRVTTAEGKIAANETQVKQLDSKITADEAKISNLEGSIAKTDAKAEKALAGIASLNNMKVERKIVLATDKKDGALFKLGSSELSDKAKQEIDAFIGSAASDPTTVILVAGYTDNSGSEDYNYALAQKRAEAVTRYLVTGKNINPTQIVTASYGEANPIADNKTRDGRAQNRRVEISVYRESINLTK